MRTNNLYSYCFDLRCAAKTVEMQTAILLFFGPKKIGMARVKVQLKILRYLFSNENKDLRVLALIFKMEHPACKGGGPVRGWRCSPIHCCPAARVSQDHVLLFFFKSSIPLWICFL